MAISDIQKQIHIKLHPNLHQALRLEAVISNCTIQELIVELVKQRITKSQFHELLKEDDQ